jgi:hypothetical protein
MMQRSQANDSKLVVINKKIQLAPMNAVKLKSELDFKSMLSKTDLRSEALIQSCYN